MRFRPVLLPELGLALVGASPPAPVPVVGLEFAS